MGQELTWGIVSTGAIAKAFARGLTQTGTGRLVAVGSRSQASVDAFADAYGVAAGGRHPTYEALLGNPAVAAVYIATPHPMHPEWAIKAAEAGKHVLCEKPLALNQWQATAMFEAARRNGVFMMEAFMYRCHPQVATLLEIIRNGEIGEVKRIQASFGFRCDGDPASRTMNISLGGGGILDVGCYPVSFARLVAGATRGLPFVDPDQVRGVGHIGETGVDEYAAAVLSFPGDIIADVATGVRLGMENVARVFGTEGSILMENPWGASRDQPEAGHITVFGPHAREIDVPTDRTSFAYEADVVAAAVDAGRQQPHAPAMTWNDTLGNLATLDAWRAELGLAYDTEQPGHSRHTVARRPPAARPGHTMTYGKVPGLGKNVSRFIMGCDNQETYAQAEILFDDWLECGGNAFDTSWVYGGGRQEVLLGQWIKARGVQDDVVVTVKGAHTPRCTPELLIEDFTTSLDRLQLEKTDLYVMHRDNPEVPTDEFMDALNELKARGRVDAFGGSNWTFARLDAANRYARQTGKQEMSILNNNLSLAHMVREVWDGCLHLSDPGSRARLERDQTVVFAWSSQARGYFLPDDTWQKLGADNFACWDSEANRIRRARAFELAEAHGVSALNVAAAYVLSQPFPTFALIGPRTVTELATCLPALNLQLSPGERAYLSLDANQKPQ